MAVPSGYTPLAKVGMVNKGTYSASATYNSLDFVYYNGSSYVAKKDGLTGVTPAEGTNWQYLAKGFLNADATGINIKDTSNLMGSGAGKAVALQTWGDKVADWLISKVITNDNFVAKLTERLVNNGTTTSTGFALDARYGKTLQDAVNTLNSGIQSTTLMGKQVLYGITNVTTDANGAGWIPFNPNFKDTTTFLLIGLPDNNVVDRVVSTIKYNGIAIVLYHNGSPIANSNGWITWIAIGNPL